MSTHRPIESWSDLAKSLSSPESHAQLVGEVENIARLVAQRRGLQLQPNLPTYDHNDPDIVACWTESAKAMQLTSGIDYELALIRMRVQDRAEQIMAGNTTRH